ncbi:MAG: hypothetical protein ACRCZF_07305, partial [Gemmataceae bacterium]
PFERQIQVQQTVKLSAAEPLPKLVKWKGPLGLVGLQSTPVLESAGPGEWQVKLPDGVREFQVVLKFAVPVGPKVAVPLVWPEAAKVGARVRVWGGGSPRRFGKFEGPWRELPPEPVPDVDALPSLTLLGSGPNLPLVLEASEAGTSPGVIVERAGIQAWPSDDGNRTWQIRTRYILRRWATTGTEIELPAGTTPPIILAAKKRLDVQLTETGIARVTLPEARPGRTTLELDIRTTIPAGTALSGPSLRGAVVRIPPRWQIATAPGTLALVPANQLAPDIRWGWQNGFYSPGTNTTPADLDAFLAGTSDLEPETEAWPMPTPQLVGRQPNLAPTSLTLILLPRTGTLVGASIAVFLIGIGIARLRPILVGPAIALVGLLLIVGLILEPQIVGQLTAVAAPGLFLLLLALIVMMLIRTLEARRAAPPAFARRMGPLPTAMPLPSSSAAVPARPGSSVALSEGTPG